MKLTNYKISKIALGLFLFALINFGVNQKINAEDEIVPKEDGTETAAVDTPTTAKDIKEVKEAKDQKKVTPAVKSSQPKSVAIKLVAGVDRTFDLTFEPHSKGITVGNKAVVEYSIVRAGEKIQLMLKPQKVGETNVQIRDQDGNIKAVYNVFVSASDLGRVVSEMKDLLKEIEGISFRVVGDKIFIDGEIIVPADLNRIVKVMQNYKETVISLVTLSPVASKIIAKKIQDDIGKPTVKVRYLNGSFLIEGTVDSEGESLRAEEIAKTYIPDMPVPYVEAEGYSTKGLKKKAVLNLLSLNPAPAPKASKMVKITVHFVEMNKSYVNSFGLKWTPLLSSAGNIQIGTATQGGVSQQGTSLTSTISNLFPKLMSAKEAGFARVLETFTIVTKLSSPAKVFKGMNVGCPVQGPNGSVTVNNTQVGLSGEIKPQQVGQSEDLEMGISFEFSVPSSTGACSGQNKNSMSTVLIVKSGESAAVGGVISNEMGNDFNKDPDAGASISGGAAVQSQPLFNLLRSKSFRKNKSQFVVFLTPQLIENASQGTDDIKSKFKVKKRK